MVIIVRERSQHGMVRSIMCIGIWQKRGLGDSALSIVNCERPQHIRNCSVGICMFDHCDGKNVALLVYTDSIRPAAMRWGGQCSIEWRRSGKLK